MMGGKTGGKTKPVTAKKTKEIQRRKRMTKEQCEILEAEFQRNPNWTGAQVKEIAQRMQLKRVKIYKWSWDRKKKA